MSQIVDRASKRQLKEQSRGQFLRRMVAMAGVFVAVGTMREACADWSLLAPQPSEFGGFTSRPAVGRNEDGRLEVFVRGANPDYPLHNIWQEVPNGGWSGMNDLGGTLTSNPVVVSNLDGRLEVFVRGSDTGLYHQWQTTPNGSWSGWDWLGGVPLTGDPTVILHGDGRLEVFVHNPDNGISHRYQGAPNGGWSGWEHFPDTNGKVNSNIAAIMYNGSTGVNFFWRGPDNRLYWKRQAGQNSAWEITRNLSVPNGRTLVGDPVVAEFDGQRSDPRLVVFARASDNAIWYRYQTAPNSTTWSNWFSLGGTWTGNVAVGTNWDGRLDLFVRKPNGDVYQTWQNQTDSTASWNGWIPFGITLITDPVVGRNQDGRLEIFGVGIDGALYNRWQETAGGSWS
jgi:hypothetical protein